MEEQIMNKMEEEKQDVRAGDVTEEQRMDDLLRTCYIIAKPRISL